MKKQWARPILLTVLIAAALGLFWQTPAQASSSAQLPTGSIPTVTGSPSGPMAMVKPNGTEPQANIRSGPGVFFDRVGVLSLGQKVPALGRSPKGDWVQVAYAGGPGGKAWVYSYNVDVLPSTAMLPIVESPPTPTPANLGTIDPTLAARFIVTSQPTGLPTFTAPPPLMIPTFRDESQPAVENVPMGFIIIGLAALGLFIGLVAFSQR